MSRIIFAYSDPVLEKAKDPNMTLDGNPLRVNPGVDLLTEKHMEELADDADKWNDPKSGSAYRAIRSMIYKGE